MVAPGGVIPKECDVCGGKFTAKRDRARFCSPRCQMRSSRAAKRGDELPPPRRESAALLALPSRAADEESFAAGTRRELEAAGRLDTYLGRAAMYLAQVADASSGDTGSGHASLMKQYVASMAAALDGVQVEQSSVERLREQARRRMGAA